MSSGVNAENNNYSMTKLKNISEIVQYVYRGLPYSDKNISELNMSDGFHITFKYFGSNYKVDLMGLVYEIQEGGQENPASKTAMLMNPLLHHANKITAPVGSSD